MEEFECLKKIPCQASTFLIYWLELADASTGDCCVPYMDDPIVLYRDTQYSRFPVGCPKIATRIRACVHLGGNFE